MPRIEPGAPANVCLVDLDAEWEVGEAGYESRSANCAFAGRRLTGRVRMTVAAGAVAYRERIVRDRGGGLSARAVLDRDRAALVVVDVQEALPARPCSTSTRVAAQRRGAGARARASSACRWWSPSSTRRASARPCPRWPSTSTAIEPLEKICFSAAAPTGFDLGGRDQALVCGIESHVCVSQTAHDLLDRGVEVHVARDAVELADRGEPRARACSKMEGAGAVVTSVETALFELLGAAGSDEFKTVQGLIK